MAKGEVIAFLHADDRYAHENVLADVAACFSAEGIEAGWLSGGMREIDLHGVLLRILPVRRFSYRRLLRNNIIMHPATFVRREAFHDCGHFDAALTYAMDYDLWLRLGKISPPLLLDDILTDFRVHSGSLSSRESLKALEESYRIRKKYVKGSWALLGHALYYRWQRLNEKLRSPSLRPSNV
jgi:GT2 family glycosyltransferase